MLKIYDAKGEIPETVQEHYTKRADGKYEPQVEGINSIGGLLDKRDELLAKVKEIAPLKTRIAELETLETLPDGKLAVDRKEFETIRAEHEAYAELGSLNDIKPKLEGYDELKTKDESRTRQEALRNIAKAENFDSDKFIVLVGDKPFDTVLKTVNENGKAVEKYFVKHANDKGKEVETAISDYVKTAPNFAPFADSLTANGSQGGTKVIRQGTTNTATPTIETEKEAVRSSGIYGL